LIIRHRVFRTEGATLDPLAALPSADSRAGSAMMNVSVAVFASGPRAVTLVDAGRSPGHSAGTWANLSGEVYWNETMFPIGNIPPRKFCFPENITAR